MPEREARCGTCKGRGYLTVSSITPGNKTLPANDPHQTRGETIYSQPCPDCAIPREAERSVSPEVDSPAPLPTSDPTSQRGVTRTINKPSTPSTSNPHHPDKRAGDTEESGGESGVPTAAENPLLPTSEEPDKRIPIEEGIAWVDSEGWQFQKWEVYARVKTERDNLASALSTAREGAENWRNLALAQADETDAAEAEAARYREALTRIMRWPGGDVSSIAKAALDAGNDNASKLSEPVPQVKETAENFHCDPPLDCEPSIPKPNLSSIAGPDGWLRK